MFSRLPTDLEQRSRPAEMTRPDIRLCPICGQTYDASQLDQAYYHDDRPHAPVQLKA